MQSNAKKAIRYEKYKALQRRLNTHGYVRKPWRIYFVGFFILAMPLISFLKELSKIGVEEWYRPSVWLHFLVLIPINSWLVIGLTFLSGLSVLVVRKTGLFVSITSLLFVFSINLATSDKFMLVALLIPTILLATSFRTPYFHKELRWWEQFPRYLLSNKTVRVFLGLQQRDLAIVNISLSGALLDTAYKTRVPNIGEKVSLEIDSGLQISTTVVRIEGSQFGVHFEKLGRREYKMLKTFVREAKKQGALYRS